MNANCASPGDFKKYFDENMQALGLPVPDGLFGSIKIAIETAGAMVSALHLLGPNAIVAELVRATFAVEKLLLAAAFYAAYYTGAVIGSIVVALSKSTGCGSSIVEMSVFLHRHQLAFSGWDVFFVRHPQVLDTEHACRLSFKAQALATHLVTQARLSGALS
jgi:hypothetical protein